MSGTKAEHRQSPRVMNMVDSLNKWCGGKIMILCDYICPIITNLGSGGNYSENLTVFSFIDYPTVDLFDWSKFTITDEAGGMYQDAGVGIENRLVTNARRR
jgi:hypothetical protein